MPWACEQTSAALLLDHTGTRLLPSAFSLGTCDVAAHERSLTSLLLLEEVLNPMGCLRKQARDVLLLLRHWAYELLVLDDSTSYQ